jgi:hypothetical protein
LRRNGALALFVIALGATSCGGASIGENEIVGRQGTVVFGAETKLAFTQRVVAGSTFPVSFRAVDEEDLPLTGGVLRSTNVAVLTIDPGSARLALIAPGTADLEVVIDGEVVDAIALHAGKPGASTLVDGALLALTDTVDARLPSSFAIRTDVEHTLLVAAVDVCGGELIDLHASTLEATDGVAASIEDGGLAAFTLKTQVAGDVALALKTPGLDDLSYSVQSIERSQVDEVDVAVTQADDAGNVTLWGRAFADDIELIGDLDLSWTADERVTLVAAQGTIVTAAVSFPAEGEPPDDRPAAVRAEVFGEEGAVDLLTATFTTERGTPARELAAEPPTPSCGGDAGEVCNPEAALLVILGARRVRRVRRLLPP